VDSDTADPAAVDAQTGAESAVEGSAEVEPEIDEAKADEAKTVKSEEDAEADAEKKRATA